MRLVVVESPYAGDIDRNVTYARACMADCFRRGEYPYASHLLFTQPGILDDDDPVQRKLGIEAGFRWALKAGAEVAFYVDLGWSRGMVLGAEFARSRNALIHTRVLGHPWSDRAPASTRHAGGEAILEEGRAP